MTGDGYDTIKRFWEIQDRGDYTKTAALFAEEALFVDPIFGTMHGRDEISAFMAKMNDEVAKIGGVFELLELAGGDDSAWARWKLTAGDSVTEGVGIYRTSNGQITFYRDYMDAPPQSG